MTMIACTLNYKKPMILGDILVSSPQAEESIQLPTNSININPYLQQDGSMATGLYQKIYIINDNVAIALAGRITEMIALLKEFRIRCSYYDPIDEAGIKSFIEGYNIAENFANSAFFIMLMVREKDSISVKQFWSPQEAWKRKESDVFEEVFACGTGADDFVYNAAEQQTFEASFEKGDVYRAIAANFGFIAKWLAIERVSPFTVNKNWGAGFETIIFNGESFMKLDQVAYLTLHGQFDKDGNIGLPIPQLIQYYQYHKDVLFISSIDVKDWRKEEKDDAIILYSENYRTDLFPVPALDLAPCSAIELPPDYSFCTNRIALGYAIITPSNGIFAPSFFTESNSLQVAYRDKKNIEVKLSKTINELIGTKSKEVFPNL